MSAAAVAVVPTASGSRYMQQLCKHWSHRFAVEYDAAHGRVPFPGGAVATFEAGEGTLTVRVEVPEASELDRMQQVVASHVDRFAFREAPLPFEWKAA